MKLSFPAWIVVALTAGCTTLPEPEPSPLHSEAQYALALDTLDRARASLSEAQNDAEALLALDEMTRALKAAHGKVFWRVWRVRRNLQVFAPQPDLVGVVEHAQGAICIVRMTENPDRVAVLPGYYLAISRDEDYRGEAVITCVDGEFAFCRITRPVPGRSVEIGDLAETNPD